VVRGLLDAGAVSDSGQDPVIAHPQGSLNALQTVPTSGATSPAPELSSATFVPNTSDGTTTVDQVLYTFNQAVAPGTSTAGQPNCAISGGATPQVTGACFFVYDTEGVMTSAANANNSGSAVESSPPAKSNDDQRTIVVTYPAGTLTHAVGAGIYENGAMLANTPGTGAHASSVPVPNTAATTRTPGVTAGPRLTGVGVLNNVSPAAGVYSFDQDVTMIAPAALSTQRLYLVDADGTVLQCANATVASGFSPGQNNIVTCTSYIVVDGSVTPNAATGAQISNAVLGGIDRGALQNFRSQQNPEGSAHTGLPPTVTAVSPAAGPEAGGSKVAIAGTNFFDVARVSFGSGNPATAFKVVSPTLITAKTPAHDAGQVHILVTTQSGGASSFSAADLFTYLPKPPHPSTKNACPDGKVSSARFTDIRGDSHRAAIDCLAWWGVAKAYKDHTFRPKRSLHRDQLATLIADTIRRSGGTLPKHPKDAFTDDRKNKHEADINAVAAAGIMTGYGSVFNPSGVVSRADFAVIAARAYQHRTETHLPSDFEYFADVAPSAPGAEEINAVAQAGIIGGYSDGTFRPGLRVHRGTAATFLVRLLDVIVRDGYAHPPA